MSVTLAWQGEAHTAQLPLLCLEAADDTVESDAYAARTDAAAARVAAAAAAAWARVAAAAEVPAAAVETPEAAAAALLALLAHDVRVLEASCQGTPSTVAHARCAGPRPLYSSGGGGGGGGGGGIAGAARDAEP